MGNSTSLETSTLDAEVTGTPLEYLVHPSEETFRAFARAHPDTFEHLYLSTLADSNFYSHAYLHDEPEPSLNISHLSSGAQRDLRGRVSEQLAQRNAFFLGLA